MVADHAVGAANYAIPQNLQSYRIRTLAPKWCLRAAMYLNCKCEHITLSIKLTTSLLPQVLEQPDSLSSEKLSILENLFTATSVPQNQTDLCRWLLSFKKVLPKAAAGGAGSTKRANLANKEATPGSK